MESFLADLLSGLAARGVATSALVHGGARASGQWEGEAPRIMRVPSYGRVLYAPISPAFPAYLERAISSTSPDVLHIHMPNPSAFWLLSSHAARRLPWVIHWHADVLTEASAWPLRLAYRPYRMLEAAMLRQAKCIIATSPGYLLASRPLQPFLGKATVIPLGIAGSRLPAAGEEARRQAMVQWPADVSLRVIVVGRFTYYKGHRTFLQALAKAPNVAAILVGDGELREEMGQLAKRLGLGQRVRFAGAVDEAQLAGLFETADVLCLPALDRAEAFGMVLLEAMRYEKPLIASNIAGSGVPWVVGQCECGLLAKPGDVDDLANVLRRLSEEPELRREMACRGAAAYRAFFRIEAVAERVSDLYRRLLI